MINLNDFPDDHLIERAQWRDPEAFVQLIRIYERRARAVASRVLAEPTTVNDIIQEAVTRAWERMGTLRDPQRFGTWFCGIVHNLALDDVRRGRLNSSCNCTTAVPDNPAKSDPLERICRQESFERLNEALAALEEMSRAALVMRYYEGLLTEDIATLLEITPVAVAMRLFRGRAKLRDFLFETN